MASSGSGWMVAEYARSGRSNCKQCGKEIGKGELRVGVGSRDARGFDLTKWHHFQCVPPWSSSPIRGLQSLKTSDQEALTTLMNRHNEACSDKAVPVQQQTHLKKRKVCTSAAQGELEIPFSASAAQGALEIPFSASAVTDKYKDANLLPKWKAFQTIIFLQPEGLQDSIKIAAFDFDGCLANTSVRRIGADAWSLMYTSIPEKLQSLYNDGFKLVIFTNEANIEIWKKKRQVAVDSKVGRLENFIKHVKLPIQVFIACGHSRSESKDPFRKPAPGMWYLMEKHFNSGHPIDMQQSFYVGDAAGRPSDHSDADIKFAEAIGLKFHVPEEFFSH